MHVNMGEDIELQRIMDEELELSNKEYIFPGQHSQEEEIELKIQSREEEILRKLGVLHLENKVTRARYDRDETDAEILEKAGVSYIENENPAAGSCEDKENASAGKKGQTKSKEESEKELQDKLAIKPLSRSEVEILRNAGVAWLENMAVIYDDDTYCHKLGCPTSVTAANTVADSTVNSTYAERELMRRLKHGWSSTGDDCQECGMPIICKSRGDLLECVICGVVGGEENYSDPIEGPEDEQEYFNPDDVVILGEEDDSPGVFDIDSTIATNEEHREYHRCHECHGALVGGIVLGEDQCMYCRTCAEMRFGDVVVSNKSNNDANEGNEVDIDAKGSDVNEEELYNEELGRKLFEGWELSKLNCPSCSLPMISEYEGAPSMCLRCG